MSLAVGLAACGVSSVFFGSMFVPIRKFDAADGIFAQWVMATAILLIGFVVFCILGFPGFYPLAMLGGMSWTIGNATAIPIISRLGMALGMLIWNTTNCLTGWAGGRFGLFGMKAHPPASSILNYGGLVCVIIGGILFSRIRSESAPEKEKDPKIRMASVESKANGTVEKSLLSSEEGSTEPDEDSVSDRDRAVKKAGVQRILLVYLCGFVAALIAGVFYGMTFVPVIYMMDNPDLFVGYPDDGLAYVFSHFFGIFLTATVIFIGYAAVKRNRPIVPSFIFLPSLASGMLWGIAQSSFFIANQHLSQAVTFPIISMLPGCVASAWSIFYFHEIRGKRNFTILAVAMAVTITGAIMVGLSKSVKLNRISINARLIAEFHVEMTFYSGIIPCIAASVLFGSIFVPIRMYDIMDGMFAQFMFAVAAQFIGFAVFVFRDFPGFYPLAMLGGVSWAIVVYMVDNPEKYPEHPAFCMDYFFSLCFGKFLAATTIFMAYSIAKNNKPILPQNIALPSFTSGLIWSIGQAFFFIANEELSPAVTFPIVSMLPNCVVSAWSVLYFHEIGGRRNFIYLAVAMAVSITGTLFVALSKSVTSPK
ncbi:unnamed protein product [Nippostrongylus brasiliensis]|uniref:Transmembrane protein 144 (inferred by orthology to a human protein) n=1 Tax=Nippostrongylus brasiliensis TaxID=27835 RepID=A0A0N4YCY3_NIPBR|nr:unnamed protein product [Nippostrongylus brasiliensis]